MNNAVKQNKNKEERFFMLNDNIVKKLFTNGGKESEDFLYAIISAAIKIPKNKIKRDFKLIHPEIAVNNKMINNEADLVYENDNIYISLEFNYNNHSSLLNRNISYVCCLYLRDLQHKEDYKDIKHIYSINIDGFDYFGKNRFIYESEFIEKTLLISRNLNVHYIDINLAYLKNKDYNELTNELERNCYLFVCNDDNVLDELYEEGSYMRKFRDEAKKLSSELDELLYYDKRKLDQEVVYDNGREDGASEKAIEIAKKMLKENIEISTIVKISGLTEEEILKLK